MEMVNLNVVVGRASLAKTALRKRAKEGNPEHKASAIPGSGSG